MAVTGRREPIGVVREGTLGDGDPYCSSDGADAYGTDVTASGDPETTRRIALSATGEPERGGFESDEESERKNREANADGGESERRVSTRRDDVRDGGDDDGERRDTEQPEIGRREESGQHEGHQQFEDTIADICERNPQAAADDRRGEVVTGREGALQCARRSRRTSYRARGPLSRIRCVTRRGPARVRVLLRFRRRSR